MGQIVYVHSLQMYPGPSLTLIPNLTLKAYKKHKTKLAISEGMLSNMNLIEV